MAVSVLGRVSLFHHAERDAPPQALSRSTGCTWLSLAAPASNRMAAATTPLTSMSRPIVMI